MTPVFNALHIAQQVAPELSAASGDTWTAEAHPRYAHIAQIARRDEATLMIKMPDDKRSGRLVIEGTFDSDLSQFRSRAPLHIITVSAGRSAHQIAAEISRRLLPAYLVDYTEATQRQREHSERTSSEAEIARNLATLIGGTHDRHDAFSGPYTTMPRVRGSVSGVSISLDISRLEESTAARILEIIKTATATY